MTSTVVRKLCLFAEEKEPAAGGVSRPNVIVHSKTVSTESAMQGLDFFCCVFFVF